MEIGREDEGRTVEEGSSGLDCGSHNNVRSKGSPPPPLGPFFLFRIYTREILKHDEIAKTQKPDSSSHFQT